MSHSLFDDGSLVIIAVVVVAGPVCHVESKPLSAHQCICICLEISHLFSFRHVSTWSFWGSLRIFIFIFFFSQLGRLHGFFILHRHHCCHRRRLGFSSTFRSHHSHFFIKNFLLFTFDDRFIWRFIPKQKQRWFRFDSCGSSPSFVSISDGERVCGAQWPSFFTYFLFKYYVLFNTFIYVDRRPLRENTHKFPEREKRQGKNNSRSDKHRPIEWEWPKFNGNFFFERELTPFIIENDVINFTNFLLCSFVQLPFPCLQQFVMVIYAKLTHSREFFEKKKFDVTAKWIENLHAQIFAPKMIMFILWQMSLSI